MRRFIEAAFQQPSRTSDGYESSSFAVLPQNTSNELTLSEVHSHLDRALRFLQVDVGYALLDDVRPHPGGGVQLQPPQKNLLAAPKGYRSARFPKEESSFGTSSSAQESLDVLTDSSHAVLDDSVIVRLTTSSDPRHGELQFSDLHEEIYRRYGKFFLEKLLVGLRINGQDCEMTWQEFEALLADFCKSEGMSEEAIECAKLVRQFLQEAPNGFSTSQANCSRSTQKALPDPLEDELPILGQAVSKYAHFQCDVVLVSRFAHVLCKSVCQDVKMHAGLSPEELKTRIESVVKHDGLYKTVLQAVRLMHLCGYEYADVVLVLAYASAYFRSIFTSIGKKMSPNEAAHVVTLLIYLAHAFLLDETCPLRFWQKHIFRKYCTLKVLDAALFRLFQMRPDFKLRIVYEEERAALLGLAGLRMESKRYIQLHV